MYYNSTHLGAAVVLKPPDHVRMHAMVSTVLEARLHRGIFSAESNALGF